MGRKPDPTIEKYFERGAKLSDSSNRYQHTCKACGEKFPKGRKEMLEAHLVRKCPALTQSQKQRIVSVIHGFATDQQGTSGLMHVGRGHNGNNTATLQPGLEDQAGQSWTALDALAEASRQEASRQTDINNQGLHGPDGAGRPDKGLRGADGFELNDRFELQEQWTPDNPPVSYEERVQREKKLYPIKLSGQHETNYPGNDLSTSPSGSPALSMAKAASIAAAASSRFEPMLDPQLLDESLPADNNAHTAPVAPDFNPNANDKYFGQRNAQDTSSSSWPMLDGSNAAMYPEAEAFEGHIDQTARSDGFSRPMTLNNPAITTEFSAEFGNGQKPNKPKVRGRFSSDRRKEVQDVRQKGACIRCRMLKKPCSSNTPCNTCAGVDNARVWKCPCIRTRTADELEMYSAGLHAVVGYREIGQWKSKVKFVNSADQIEVSHFPDDTGIFATYMPIESVDAQQALIDKSIDPSLAGVVDYPTGPIRLLDNENDDIPFKLEAYVRQMSATFFEREESHFMRSTLETAVEISAQKRNDLLTNALELWATVHLLCDHEVKWQVFLKPATTVSIEQPAERIPIQDSFSYNFVVMQLNAAAEKRAAVLCKTILNDLERHLLSKASNHNFETFLVGLILLNCIEKSTWLFKSWDQDFHKPLWPLDKTPGYYATQGDRVTELLVMLLKIRNIPPKTYRLVPDGTIATDVEGAPRDYYNRIHLDWDNVVEKGQNPKFDPAQSRCYEMRFCAYLLLPGMVFGGSANDADATTSS